MAGRLAGKTALVTAAGRGIGRASALAFAAEGAQVCATDIDADALGGLPPLDNMERRRLDVTDGAAVTELAGELGALDILFNCAGWVHNGTILDCEEADWDRTLDVNAKAMYRTIRATLPAMLETDGGSIVNVASTASSVSGVRMRFAYGASKAAVIGLTKAVAADFVDRNIRCNAICPGTVDTPSLAERIAAFDDPEAARKAFVTRQPMGRLGQPGEIAKLVVYLASDEASFTTGTINMIDGGMTL